MSLPTLSAWLLTYWLHSTVLLTATALLTTWFVKNDAWRETLWKTALLGALVTASLQSWTGAGPVTGRWDLVAGPATAPTSTELDRRTAGPEPSHKNASAEPADGAVPPASAVSTLPGASATRPPAPVTPDVPWVAVLLGTWAAAAAALVIRLVQRHRRLGRLLSDRRRVGEPDLLAHLADLTSRARVSRAVRLSASTRCATPLALGVSEICVPERLLDLGPDEQRGALAHEVAHLARHDPSWQLAAAVLESIFFFQPLNRLGRRRLRDAAEHLCDDWAVRQSGSPIGLARCLAEVAAWVGRHPEPVPEGTLGMAEHGSGLLRRVERLLMSDRRSPRPGIAARSVVVGAVLMAVGAFAPAVGHEHADLAPALEAERLPDEPVVAGDVEVRTRTDARVSVDVPGPATETTDTPDEQQPTVVKHPDPSQSLEARWTWALAEATRRGGPIWIGWVYESQVGPGQIHVTDSENWSNRGLRGRPNLVELLGFRGSAGAFVALFEVAPGDGGGRVSRIAGRSADLGFRFGTRPVYWLGSATDTESFRFLTEMFRRSDHAGHRETLVDLIAVHPASDAVVPFLRDVLTGGDTEVIRAEAAEGFEWHPGAASVRILRSAALEDRSAHVRAEAAEALGEIRRDDARDALVEIARTGGRAGAEAVEALGEHPGPRTLELLSELVFGPHPRAIQREAVETIGDLAGDETAALLERIARTHPDPDVRDEALDALGDDDDDARVRILSEVIRDGGPERIRREAIDAIGGRADPAALETLVRVALDDPAPELQREAVEQLINFRAAEAAPALRRIAFEASREATRQQAAETLGDLPAEVSLPALDEIIDRHPDPDVVQQAVESLGNYPASVSQSRLEAILRSHPSIDARREALDQLESIGAFRSGRRRSGG